MKSPIKIVKFRKKITKVIFKSKPRHHASGCECTFYIINKTTGLKVWRRKKDATYSRTHQARAAKIQIGPKVLSPVIPIYKSPIKSVSPYYGYITERAYQSEGKNHYFDLPITESLIQKAVDNNCLSHHRYDDHSGNFGLIGDRPVILDFGEENWRD